MKYNISFICHYPLHYNFHKWNININSASRMDISWNRLLDITCTELRTKSFCCISLLLGLIISLTVWQSTNWATYTVSTHTSQINLYILSQIKHLTSFFLRQFFFYSYIYMYIFKSFWEIYCENFLVTPVSVVSITYSKCILFCVKSCNNHIFNNLSNIKFWIRDYYKRR